MKKSTIIGIVIAGIILLGSGGVYATGQIARSNAIAETDAINFAFVDAGVSPDDGVVNRIEFDYDKGKFVYEITFVANGVEYEYVVDSANGKIIEKDSEVLYQVEAQTKEEPAAPATEQTAPTSETISLDEAKTIALSNAGASLDQVIFEKAKLSREDGKLVYDIEFYVPGSFEYDCEVDAYTGDLVEESYEELVSIAGDSGNTSSGSGNSSSSSGGSSTSGGSASSSNSSSSNNSSSTSSGGTSTPSSSAPSSQSPQAPAPTYVDDDDDDYDDYDDNYDDDKDDYNDDRYDRDDNDYDDNDDHDDRDDDNDRDDDDD